MPPRAFAHNPHCLIPLLSSFPARAPFFQQMSVRNYVGHVETSLDSPPFDSLNAAMFRIWGAVDRHHLSTASKAGARGTLSSESTAHFQS